MRTEPSKLLWALDPPDSPPPDRYQSETAPNFRAWKKLSGFANHLLVAGVESKPDRVLDLGDGSVHATLPPDSWTCGLSALGAVVTLRASTLSLRSPLSGQVLAQAQLAHTPQEVLVGLGGVATIDRGWSEFAYHRIQHDAFERAWVSSEIPKRHGLGADRVFLQLRDSECEPVVTGVSAHDGESVWTASGELELADDLGALLYRPVDASVACLDGATGRVQWTWRYQVSKPSEQAAASHDRVVATGPRVVVVQGKISRKSTTHTELIGLSRVDGQELWRRRWTGGSPACSLLPCGSLVLWDDVDAQAARASWEWSARSSVGPRPDYSARLRIIDPQGAELVSDPVPSLVDAFPDSCSESRSGQVEFLPRFRAQDVFSVGDRVVVLTGAGRVLAFALPSS